MILDCTHVPHGPSNHALEYLSKSVEEAGLWHPHPTSRLLSAMEQASTIDVCDQLELIRGAALKALTGVGEHALTKAVPDDLGPKCRKLERQLRDVEPGTLDLDTYLDVLDCWLWRYLPPALAAQQAKRRAVQQYLLGLLRYAGEPRDPAAARDLVEHLPATIEAAKPHFPLASLDEARIRVAQASAARHVQAITARTRSAMQEIIINAERRRIVSGHTAYDVRPLEQQLQDAFGELNRDWRRIAVTETAINASDAYLSRFKPGEKVKWLAHPGACRYCEDQNGTIFTVVAPDHPKKDPHTMVWVGKHAENIGRSMAKRKRLESGELVDREPHELLIPAIPSHPSCRCTYSPATFLEQAA